MENHQLCISVNIRHNLHVGGVVTQGSAVIISVIIVAVIFAQNSLPVSAAHNKSFGRERRERVSHHDWFGDA
jgi:hypothetical protein